MGLCAHRSSHPSRTRQHCSTTQLRRLRDFCACTPQVASSRHPPQTSFDSCWFIRVRTARNPKYRLFRPSPHTTRRRSFNTAMCLVSLSPHPRTRCRRPCCMSVRLLPRSSLNAGASRLSGPASRYFLTRHALVTTLRRTRCEIVLALLQPFEPMLRREPERVWVLVLLSRHLQCPLVNYVQKRQNKYWCTHAAARCCWWLFTPGPLYRATNRFA